MDCLYRSPTRRLIASRRGFALLITITLVAFLVLILVSLAALTRVETQVATNSQQLNHARQHALMALNIALGQLQKYAGPDQRVTTTADLIADQDKAGVAAPSSLYTTTPRVDVKPGSRHWTAAWGNTESNIGYNIRPHLIPPTTGNRRGVTPGLLNWLISGNESAAFTANGTLGGVTAGTDITYAPGDPVDLTNPDAPTVKGDPAVILVGPNSVGDTPDAMKDYVVAPLKNIEAAASSIPGADATSTTPIRTGRYAWWVGDEGVKARVNLQNGYQKTGDTTDQINSFISAQRSGVEFMDRDALGTDNLSTDYIFTAAALPNVNTPQQLSLLGADTTAQNNLSTAAKSRFHDITTSSYGVLSDTYAGGLKKDLTADIADSSSDFAYRPSDDTPIFTPINTSEAYLPTWGHLRTWARTHPGSSGEITPSPASDTNAGIGPVLQYSAIGFDIRVRGDRTVTLAIFPVIALYNPYPVPIAAARYDVGFKLSANSRLTIQTHPPLADPNAVLVMDNWVRQGEVDWGVPEVRPGNTTGTASNNIVFTVDSQVIPPGESHIYYLGDADSDTPYAPGQLLQRAPAGESANPLNYVYLPSSLTFDPSVVITDPVPTAEDPDPAPTSHMMRLIHTNPNNSPGTSSSGWNGGNAPFATVTLAAEGGVDDSQAWYHRSSVLTGTTGMNRRQVICFDETLADNVTDPGHSAAFTMAKAYDRFRISNIDSWAGETQGPRSAFRYCPRNTNGGDYQAADRTGTVQISTIWLRHSNLRSHYGQLTLSESATTNRDITRRGNMLFGVVLANDNATNRKVVLYPRPNEFALSMAHTPDAGGNPSRYSTYFDIMERPESLQSLGQLQHAPLSRFSFQTTYPFANSMADLRIPRTAHFKEDNVPRPDNGTPQPSYDLSWHLNRAIWDKYFLSTASTSLAQTDIDTRKPLPNARLTYVGSPEADSVRFSASQKDAYDQAAANLLNAGAFNINSTSEQAWRAVLSGTYGVPQNTDYATPGDRVDRVIPFARFSQSLSRPAGSGSGLYGSVVDSMVLDTTTTGPHNSPTQFANTLAHGNRGLLLTDPSGVATTNDTAENLVNELARTMVVQVRSRGPFLSLADFVNRSMATTKHDLGIKGAIQTAIDTMVSSQANPFERWNSVNKNAVTATGYFMSDTKQLAYPDWDLEHYLGGPEDLLTTDPDLTAYRFAYANTPKYLTQADILSTIGPSLSARSDTFTIRTYGEKRNPTTDEIEGRAWCEAVVQRIPDFVDSSNPAHTALADVSAENRAFGRKFVVVSFRWLAPSDI